MMRSLLGMAVVGWLAGIVSAQAPTAQTPPALAQESGDQRLEVDTTRQPEPVKSQSELFTKFTKLMTGAKLNGVFSIDGQAGNQLLAESYEIEKVEKQPEADQWVITARIKYGDKDGSFPVPVEVKWAGRTPVITLDNITIPGLGTFSARVLFHGQRYAGTWQHDDQGGHMFGQVELAK